jgi:SnoaL-like protein
LSYDGNEKLVKLKETVVRDYFNKLASGDIDRLLKMFTDNAAVHEPFSKLKTLNGRAEIESFLKVVVMANEGMHQELVIEKAGERVPENQITAIVTFQKGSSIKCRFIFELNMCQDPATVMIQNLGITLIG